MDNRNARAAIAKDTVRIIKQGYYVNSENQRIDIATAQAFAQEHTISYSPEKLDELIEERASSPVGSNTTIEFTRESSLEAVCRLIAEGCSDVLCLNFASAKNPGGGFLGGSQAQEESLARSSGLYGCLLQAPGYYERNRAEKGCFYTDYMIYSPQVPIVKDDAGNCLDTLTQASFITAPAVNIAVVKRRDPGQINQVEVVMKRRIEKVLTVAKKHGHSTLVLGAWGCGVFANKPEDVSGYFSEVIKAKFADEFSRIVFAVYGSGDRTVNIFRSAFGF